MICVKDFSGVISGVAVVSEVAGSWDEGALTI